MGFKLKYLTFPLFSLGLFSWYSYNIYVLLPFSILDFFTGHSTLIRYKEFVLSGFLMFGAILIILSSMLCGAFGDYLFFPFYRKLGLGRWKQICGVGCCVLIITIFFRGIFVVPWNYQHPFVTMMLDSYKTKTTTTTTTTTANANDQEITITAIFCFIMFSFFCAIGDICYGIIDVCFFSFFNQNCPADQSGVVGGFITSGETGGFLVSNFLSLSFPLLSNYSKTHLTTQFKLGVTIFGTLCPYISKYYVNILMCVYLIGLFSPLLMWYKERKYSEDFTQISQHDEMKTKEEQRIPETETEGEDEGMTSLQEIDDTPKKGNEGPAKIRLTSTVDSKRTNWKNIIWWKDFIFLFIICIINLNAMYLVEEFMAYYLTDVIKPTNFTLPFPFFHFSDDPSKNLPLLPFGIEIKSVPVSTNVETAQSICMFFNNFSGVVFSLIAGWICQKIGARWVLSIALLVGGIFSVMYSFSATYFTVTVLQLVQGVSDGFFFPSHLNYLNNLFFDNREDKQKDRKVGIGIAFSLTAFVAPNIFFTPLAGLTLSVLQPFKRILIFGVEVHSLNYKILYLSAALYCFLTLFLIFSLTDRRHPGKDNLQKKEKMKYTDQDDKFKIATPTAPNDDDVKDDELINYGEPLLSSNSNSTSAVPNNQITTVKRNHLSQ